MKLFWPVALMGLLVAAIVGAWLLWPQEPQPSSGAQPKAAGQKGATLTLEGAEDQADPALVQPSQMRYSLPEDIRPTMIQQIREQNGRKVLVFDDGSELELTPYLMSQLSPEVRLRVEYKRGQ